MFVKKITLLCEKENLIVNYYLTEKMVEIENDLFNVYGVKVVSESKDKIETEIVDDISSDRNEVLNLISMLSDYSVTPATLFDIIYDYLCA